jgi:outer membrane biosynthesis protein TonB
MNTFGIERRWSGPSGTPPWIGRRRSLTMAVALVTVGVVFACFFAIGRATAPSSARAETPVGLPVASVGAAIPVQLVSASPIDIFVPAPPPPRPTPKPRSQPASVPTTAAPVQTVTPSAPAPTPQATPTPQPAPVHQTAPSAPAPSAPQRSAPSTPSSGSGGSSHSGGGTFESSG